MKYRNVSKLIHSRAVSEGAGVTVHRSIGTAALKHLDPFLMLDFFCSDNPDEYIAGFPDHPHRGFVTLTYMLDGHMLHQDSMGNKGNLRSGGAQWMKAASGVIHSEIPQQESGLMRGFQLWINLPASEKMSAPLYQEFPPEQIPVIELHGSKVKVLSGSYQGMHGPISDPQTNVHYLDVTLMPGASLALPLDATMRGFAYLFEGGAQITGTAVPLHGFAVLGEGDAVLTVAGGEGARFILVAGNPLDEPIVQGGPFVMNTEAEIHQAFADYRDGRLVQARACIVTG